MDDTTTQEDLFTIKKECEKAIETIYSYGKVSDDMKIDLSDFNLGQLNGINRWALIIKELVIELIAERDKKGDLK